MAENLRQQLDAATAPLKEQLQQLSQSTSDEGRRHEEVDRQLQALGNRIGGLGELQNAFERAGNVRDDLKLETGELRAQVRNLEESSSRLAVNQSTQEARTRELEGLLAELTLKQQNLAAADATLAESLRQQLDAAIAPLREQLQQLSQSASDEGGRLKEVDRRLQDLGNRIGDLGGRFHHLSEDVANQREQREHLERELDPRLQQLEARNTDIDDLESQLGAALKKETDALWRALEEKDRDVETLQEQLAALSDSEQSPEIDQKLSGVAAEVSRLSEAEDFLQESFRGLGGLELNLTSRLDDLHAGILSAKLKHIT
ncbi:MAG TPA: hypothetical protein PLZ16_16375, partial [Gammaproteobacteria bacterium]|nr:hypothetical protein [Gammaproteobacteria bacterium]